MPQEVSYTIGSANLEIWDRFAVNSTFSIGNSGTHFPCDTSSGSFTVTLPPAADNIERIINIKKLVAANTLTIQGDSGELIEGASSVPLTVKGTSLTLTSNGTGWELL